MDLLLWVAATDTIHIADVGGVHSYEEVEAVIVTTCHLTGGLTFTADAVLSQFAFGRGIDLVANLLRGGGSRLDLEVRLTPSLHHEVLHHKLCHRTATDVPMTHEQYPFHL